MLERSQVGLAAGESVQAVRGLLVGMQALQQSYARHREDAGQVGIVAVLQVLLSFLFVFESLSINSI